MALLSFVPPALFACHAHCLAVAGGRFHVNGPCLVAAVIVLLYVVIVSLQWPLFCGTWPLFSCKWSLFRCTSPLFSCMCPLFCCTAHCFAVSGDCFHVNGQCFVAVAVFFMYVPIVWWQKPLFCCTWQVRMSVLVGQSHALRLSSRVSEGSLRVAAASRSKMLPVVSMATHH